MNMETKVSSLFLIFAVGEVELWNCNKICVIQIYIWHLDSTTSMFFVM